jgi:hypothetical protein
MAGARFLSPGHLSPELLVELLKLTYFAKQNILKFYLKSQFSSE